VCVCIIGLKAAKMGCQIPKPYSPLQLSDKPSENPL
jgi:hypothetical protein